MGPAPFRRWPVEGVEDEKQRWNSAQGSVVQPTHTVWGRFGWRKSSLEVRAAPAVAEEALAAVQISNGAAIYAEALAGGMLFYILDSRLAFPGSAG